MHDRTPWLAPAALAIVCLIAGCESKVTIENFDAIQVGMTLAEVEGILGPGEKQTTATMTISQAGIIGSGHNQATEDTYLWKEDGPNQPYIVVMFREGKVVSKRHSGL